MAKKKEKVEQSQNKSPEISIGDGQKYNGNASVRVVKNSHIIKNLTKHNAGGIPLFNFLIACLNSNYELGGVPNYIGLGYNNGVSTSLLHSVSIPKVSSFVSTKTFEGTGESVPQINYQFTIPASYLSATPTESNKVVINRLQLYDSNHINQATNFSAEIILDPLKNETIILDPSNIQKYTIFITWSLYITN